MSRITENQRNECESNVNDIAEALDEFETQLQQQNVTTDTLLNYLDLIDERMSSLRQKVEEING